MNKHKEDSMEFVKTELLPEAVHNRCFCDDGSREFVEFISVTVEPLKRTEDHNDEMEYFRARLTVNFSGEPRTFPLIIKMLNHVDGDNRCYDKMMNEEMFYSKMTKLYDLDIFAKCYVADMGRYGRPVIVLEDLEACGYVRVDSGKLDEYHLELCLEAIARFHRRGLTLKAENFNSFREFYAKLIDVESDVESFDDLSSESLNRILEILKKLRYQVPPEIVPGEPSTAHVTMCHGRLVLRRSFFFVRENGKPVRVKVIGWNGMRYCSIVFDLARILRDNLANNDEVERLMAVWGDAWSSCFYNSMAKSFDHRCNCYPAFRKKRSHRRLFISISVRIVLEIA